MSKNNTLQILNRFNGSVIFEAEAENMSELVKKAIASSANLSSANLSSANLSYADLSSANLSYADLSYADLSSANLSSANLSSADLSYADLSSANLSYADLSYANLLEVNFREVKNLDKAHNLPRIPKVENIDAKILEKINQDPKALDMGKWHACDTTHCRAGWAIHLAGEAGYVLESFLGPKTAGALIYHASTGNIPDFFAENETALEDIKSCAAKPKA